MSIGEAADARFHCDTDDIGERGVCGRLHALQSGQGESSTHYLYTNVCGGNRIVIVQFT